jgi:hypothetical protein
VSGAQILTSAWFIAQPNESPSGLGVGEGERILEPVWVS